MSELQLTQSEADALIAMEKRRASDETYSYPGGSLTVPLWSADRREEFLLDLSRGRINLLKGTYQTRARHVVILVRLDFGGAPHRNPDGEEVACPHLHLYREGFADKWAVPAPGAKFARLDDLWATLDDFCAFCNVTEAPDIARGLFI